MATSAYIHIPFCRQKCRYCSLASFSVSRLRDVYIEALREEIKNEYNKKPLKTLYMGGGTPSLLEIEEVEKIISHFVFDKNCEVTIEVNPEKTDLKYFKDLKSIGVNRLSIGIQTFDDEILKAIGRFHTAFDAFNSINYAIRAGFENISLDFIYGLPSQTLKKWKRDVETAKEFGIKHISLYGLKIESPSYFYKNPPKFLPDNDLQAQMYEAATECLSDFEHYEISNFAKKDYESKHNLNYWDRGQYWGFGAAAHGFLNDMRYFNTLNLEEYIKNPLNSKKFEKITPEIALEEEIMLSLRKAEGLDIEKIDKLYNIDFGKKCEKTLKKYEKFVTKTSKGFRFNIKGFLISNEILAELI